MNRLYRSRDDRMLAGVAGGLAEMWGADPSLVRVIWALLVIFTGGIALLVYIVMALVVPEEPTSTSKVSPRRTPGRRRTPEAKAAALGGARSPRRGPTGRRRRARGLPASVDPRRVPDHPRWLLPGPRIPARDRLRLVLAAGPRRPRRPARRHRDAPPERTRLTLGLRPSVAEGPRSFAPGSQRIGAIATRFAPQPTPCQPCGRARPRPARTLAFAARSP